jgi:hypothetical protein
MYVVRVGVYQSVEYVYHSVGYIIIEVGIMIHESPHATCGEVRARTRSAVVPQTERFRGSQVAATEGLP